MNETIGIFGAMITITSFLYALYENRQRRKLLDYNREQAWEIYRQAAFVIQFYQFIEKSNSSDNNIVVNAAKGERSAQELLVSSIRMIKRFEKRFDREMIEKWAKDGKLPNESHMKTFLLYV